MDLESRRSFNGKLLGSLVTFGLVETLFTRDLFAADARPMIGKWVVELSDLCRSKNSTSAATCRSWSS